MSTGAPTQPLPSGPESLADGRYALHRRLGAGGMSVVLQATDTRLERDVAVKLLADNLAQDDTARERFLREARLAAGLSDPHVVQVHDVDEEDGRPYLVMELVDGPSLADVLATDGPLAPREVVDVAADALAGLAHAHERGLLHRDVKPGNLLRTASGVVKVADFGVARAGDDPDLTRGGTVVGTAPYLAPERATGAAASVATDLFALGATLHELLTGHTPEAGAAPVPDTALPGALAHLLERLLARDPVQRPTSARTALALLAGEVEPTGPVPLSGSAGPPAGADGPPPAPTGTATTSGPVGEEDPPATPASRAPAVPWGAVVGAALALLLLGVAFQALREPGAAEAPAGVERTEDPAGTARNLSEWLRERAGE